MKNLNVNKAHGWDHLSIIIIKACGNSISLPFIFKSMINEGVFPEDWKNSNVVPIHEKESKNLIKNYRLISLLSIFSKLFERLVFNALFNIIVQKKNYSLPVSLDSYLVTPAFLNYYQPRMKFTEASIVTQPPI